MAFETARTYPFDAHLETSTGAPDGYAEARYHRRRALRLDTSGALEDGSRANVTLHNISAAGLLIESDPAGAWPGWCSDCLAERAAVWLRV